MTDMRPNNRIEAPGKPGAELIADLDRLRDSHRLGIHIWERGGLLEPPHYSLGLLHHPADSIAQRMANQAEMPCRRLPLDPEAIPAMSLSLLPSSGSGKAMMPYNDANFRNGGYLMDLTQEQAHPPRILVVARANLGSDRDQIKHLVFYNGYVVDRQLRHFYRDKTAQELIARASGPQGAAYGAQQLDALGQCHHVVEKGYAEAHIVDHNEVIASASLDHVKAIVHPSMQSDLSPHMEPLLRLCAALHGLQSHEQGLPLPVVIYHVNGPRANGFTCLSTTVADLQQAGRKALHDLATTPDPTKQFYNNFNFERASLEQGVKDFLDVSDDVRETALFGNAGRTR